MLLQKHKRKAAVSRKVVERILPPTYKVSRLRGSSSDRSVPQIRSEHLKRNGALSAGAKARRRHEEFVNRLSSPLGSSVNREATCLIKYRVQVDLDGLLENSAY